MDYNPNIAYLSIFPGAGGDDAKDWAEMLIRMYSRYAGKKNWQKRLIDEGTLEIRGEGAYKFLKDENGVHRLVRISPFDAKHLRHTSFALVEVLPEIKEQNLNIPDCDLKFEFYRSSGPGGQNVNKVETAVRVTHVPTGLKAASQIERAQVMNRERALKLLTAKILKTLEEKKEKTINNLKTKIEPDWGHEIRSYVLHPYKQVKNHANRKKITKVEEVLGGNLDLLKKLK